MVKNIMVLSEMAYFLIKYSHMHPLYKIPPTYIFWDDDIIKESIITYPVYIAIHIC